MEVGCSQHINQVLCHEIEWYMNQSVNAYITYFLFTYLAYTTTCFS